MDSFCTTIKHVQFFPDHHNYKEKSIKLIKDLLVRHGCSSILTTKKDFYKVCMFFEDISVFVIDVHHEVQNFDRFTSFFKKKYFTQ